MPHLGRSTRNAAATVCATGLVLVCGQLAFASPVDRTEGGSSNDGDLHAGAEAEEIRWDHSANGDGSGSGNLAPAGTGWSPPPCWYAPTWTPDELREYGEVNWDPSTQPAGHAQRALGWMQDHYDGGNPYEDYNADADGEGMWWGAVENPNEPDPVERNRCTEIPFWVDSEELPEVENALTPQVLAELAYERLRVPETNVTLSPADPEEQIVNLPTWVWAESGAYASVAVTASLESWDIWATTTATPTGLTLRAGTENAELLPTDGRCPINDDGSVGEPYRENAAGEVPPCGLTYLRATHHTEAYPLTVSVTWDVSWEGSDGSAETLPEAVFETTHQVQVNEVQSIVR